MSTPPLPLPRSARRVVAVGRFSAPIPPLPPRLAELHVEPLRCNGIDQLPTLGSGDILLADMAWLNSLAPEERVRFATRAAGCADWVALSDGQDRFKDQVEWQRAGVRHFFDKPLDPERLAALVEDIHDRLSGPPVRAILVDDDEASLEAHGAMLRAAGIDVLTTTDPLLVVDVIAEHRPDVLVVDIEMPGCRGTELLTILRQRAAHADLPAIYLTAHRDTGRQLQARVAAAEDILTKPVAPELLVGAVTGLAWRHRSRARAERLRSGREQQARQRAEYLHRVIDEHAIVSTTDVRGVITYANDKFCAVSGYDREELVGQYHRIVRSDMHGPEVFREMWRTIANGKVWQGVVCNRRKDGGHYWGNATIMPRLDAKGKPVEYLSVRTDITELKRRETELRESEARLAFAVEGAGDGVWDWDVASGAVKISGHCESMLGYTPGEILATIDAWVDLVHPDGRGPMQQALGAYLKGTAPSYGIELRLRCKNGDYKWVLSRGTATERDAAGRPTRMIGIHSDISARKAVENELIAARENADRANRAKSDFLSSMSHELRTPMNAILGFAQMLEYDGALDENQRDNVQEILRAGQHLLDLINEVLDLAKIESGRIDLSMEGIDLPVLGEDCRHIVQPLAARRGIALEIDLDGTAQVFADRVRLKQVLINLLSNAVKYNRDAGRVRVDAVATAPGRLRIRVADTGPGIDPARVAELFQPFNRLGAENTEIEGTGIGLTISRRLVELMGGEIGVENLAGAGSRFWIELSAHDAASLDADAHGAVVTSSRAVASGSDVVHILAVDDNPTNLKLISRILGTQARVRLRTAHAPELAIEMAMAQPPDLILLDINMPGLDGYQVLDVLRGIERLSTVPVIAVTANAMPADLERGRAAGFDDYLTKPVVVDRLMAGIEHCLSRRRPAA